MDPKLQELLRQAQAAIAAGADTAAVNKRLAELSGGKLTSVNMQPEPSAPAAPVPGPAAKRDDLSRMLAQGPSAMARGAAESYARDIPLKDATRLNLQGATFGFGDELAGFLSMLRGKGYEAGRDASRENLERIRQEHPVASRVAEFAGGAPVPIGAGMQAARPILGGMAAGGAGGLLYGAGEGEGLLGRVKGGTAGGLLGAATGGVLGAAPVVAAQIPRMAGGRGARVAGELENLTGLSSNITKLRKEANAAIKDVAQKVYGQFDELGKLDDPEILALYRSEGFRPKAKDAPTFRDLQDLRATLRKERNFEKARALDDLMQNKFGDALKQADAEYFKAQEVIRGMEKGRRLHNSPRADIDAALEKLSPEGQQAFRQGQLYQITSKLRRGNEKDVALLNRLLDSGPETQAIMRSMFPDDQSFGQFLNVLAKEKKAKAVWSAFKKWGGRAGLLGAGAAGYEVLN